MAPGGEMFRYPLHFGENVLRHGSHEWLPYSKNGVRLKSSNTNLSFLPSPIARVQNDAADGSVSRVVFRMLFNTT